MLFIQDRKWVHRAAEWVHRSAEWVHRAAEWVHRAVATLPGARNVGPLSWGPLFRNVTWGPEGRALNLASFPGTFIWGPLN